MLSRFNVDEKDPSNPCEYGFRPMPSIKILSIFKILMACCCKILESNKVKMKLTMPPCVVTKAFHVFGKALQSKFIASE